MNFEQLLAARREALNKQISLSNEYTQDLEKLRSSDNPDQEEIQRIRELKASAAAKMVTLRADLAAIQADSDDTDRLLRLASGSHPHTPSPEGGIARAELGGSGSTRKTAASDGWINTQTGQRAAVRSDESFGAHPVTARGHNPNDSAAIAQYGDLGQMIRAMTTTGGSAIVPTGWSSDLIDRARNASAVIQAGAQIIPMDAKVVQIGRLTGDPTSAFRAEGTMVAPSDLILDNVTLTATTQSCLVIGSMEWFQDADNADEIVSEAISKAIALQLDITALYGGIIAGAGTINLPTPPNPRGILAALNANLPANVLGAAVNGTTQTTGSYWNELLDLIYTVKDRNETPNAVIYNSKLARQYARAYDTTGQPLRPPVDITEIPKFTSNQIPSYTQGTMANQATDVFAGDFTKLLIGQRLGITIQVLTERYADNGQIGLVAHWRGDTAPARSSAFAVYKALKGA